MLIGDGMLGFAGTNLLMLQSNCFFGCWRASLIVPLFFGVAGPIGVLETFTAFASRIKLLVCGAWVFGAADPAGVEPERTSWLVLGTFVVFGFVSIDRGQLATNPFDVSLY